MRSVNSIVYVSRGTSRRGPPSHHLGESDVEAIVGLLYFIGYEVQVKALDSAADALPWSGQVDFDWDGSEPEVFDAVRGETQLRGSISISESSVEWAVAMELCQVQIHGAPHGVSGVYEERGSEEWVAGRCYRLIKMSMNLTSSLS